VSGPLLAIFAHPDDETFSAAGLLAAAVEGDRRVTVLSATRGEAGKSSVAGLDTPERLGAAREAELRHAMAVLGVDDVRFLRYRDSGLEARPVDPLALTNATVVAVAAALIPHIRDVRPSTLITFGPDGVYGHPDHLHVHRAVRRVVQEAREAEPWRPAYLYFATAPREAMQAMIAGAENRFDWMSPEMRANLGTPQADITHALDITPWAERKRRAILAHLSQTGPGGPLGEMPDDQMARWLSREYFVRAPLLWSPGTDDELFSQLATEQLLDLPNH
jgi:N-acetyl-1-D-myo-inositol-2-amino-2-deoxy-alpha-D-glucopyranoside deacetylase